MEAKNFFRTISGYSVLRNRELAQGLKDNGIGAVAKTQTRGQVPYVVAKSPISGRWIELFTEEDVERFLQEAGLAPAPEPETTEVELAGNGQIICERCGQPLSPNDDATEVLLFEQGRGPALHFFCDLANTPGYVGP